MKRIVETNLDKSRHGVDRFGSGHSKVLLRLIKVTCVCHKIIPLKHLYKFNWLWKFIYITDRNRDSLLILRISLLRPLLYPTIIWLLIIIFILKIKNIIIAKVVYQQLLLVYNSSECLQLNSFINREQYHILFYLNGI